MDEFAEITEHLLRFSPDALIVIDDQGLIRFANDTVKTLFGYEPQALVGQPLDLLVPERLRARHDRHVAGFMREPSNRAMGARIVDLFARRADSSEFAAGIRLAPFRIHGKLFVAAAIRDITERQQISAELVAAREEAERANRAKSRFLATASHDLRQPLQTIKMLNAAMRRLAGNEELAELLKHQEQAIENTTRLLNALLDISRLESGTIEPQESRVYLPDLLEEIRAEFESIAHPRGLRFTVHAQRVTLLTDRVLFSQLLQNLVGNAIKYTDAGEVTIDSRLDNGELSIIVRDTGIGIPQDKLDRIFDEYYQVDTHGAKRRGVGLGLAIVKEVARLLECSVTITSTVGCWTEATVRVPAARVLSPALETPPSRTVSSEGAATPKTRVFLVEDNEGVRMATALFLKLEGFEVLSASSFVEFQALIPSVTPTDVIVADYHLESAHTGLEVLQSARQQLGTNVPGVILSGDLPSLVRTVSASLPATKFLSKPVDTEALLQAIQELSAQSREACCTQG